MLSPVGRGRVDRLDEAGRGGWEKDGQVGWDEGSVHMSDEAHALAAVGAPAVDPLIRMLRDGSEWSRICAAFALGEMDGGGTMATPELTAMLDDDSHRLVRTAIDSLGMVGGDTARAVPRLARFLVENRPDWEENLTGRRAWCARDRVRINAAIALMRLAQVSAAEEALVQALDDETGYVSLYAAEALRTQGSPAGLQAALEMALAQRWDASLSAERPYRGYTWFVGFAPAEDPQIAVATLIVNTPRWRIKAAYAAREALRYYLVEKPRAEAAAAAPTP